MARVRKVKGSITVEAVFIVPIILFIILAFLFFTMYLHDRTVVTCVMNEACERFSQSVKEPANYDSGVIYYDKMTEKSLLAKYTGDYSVELKSMKNYVEDRLSKRMMLSKVKKVQTKKGINDVKVTVDVENRIPLLQALVYLSGIQTCRYEVEGGIYNPSEYARAADVSLDVLAQTGVYDTISKVFNKIENALK